MPPRPSAPARDAGRPVPMEIIDCGRFAHAALSSGPGEVCAVFRRSAYLRFAGNRYACLGDAALGRGPLNALVADSRALGALAPGMRMAVPRALPPPHPPRRRKRRLHPGALAENLARLALASRTRSGQQGLGASIGGGDNALLRHARPALRGLDRWLEAGCGGVPAAVHGLLGLGPGLTPSGDDYLGGAMLALRLLGRHGDAATLWRGIGPRAPERTPAISLAHLAAAAAGEAHEELHQCIDALFAPRVARWDAALARLDGLGHCSGWDGLAGAAAVARQALR